MWHVLNTIMSGTVPHGTPAIEEVTILSLRSKLPSAVLACVLLGAGAGCVHEPSAPKCASTSLTQAAMRGDTVVLNTGLRYIETKGGAGEAIQWCHPVTVHYTAYIENGTRLESSHDLDIPLAFTPGLGDLIDGFEQGVIGLRVQGTRRVIVPPQLGYGGVAQQTSSGVVIPANSTLIYDIEAITTQ